MAKKKRVSLKDMPLTRAQVVMRDEMLGQKRVAQFYKDEERASTEPQPLKLSLEEILGTRDPDKEIEQMALAIINAGPSIQTSLANWSAIQSLVESGIRAGLSHV